MIRCPNSRRKCFDLGPIIPEVSIAMGTKVNLSSSDLYFVCFEASAEQHFEPGKAADEERAEGEKVSEQVASHARHFPLANGKVVMPSGRFPSPLSRPAGSRIACIPAASSAPFTISLMALWRGKRPAL